MIARTNVLAVQEEDCAAEEYYEAQPLGPNQVPHAQTTSDIQRLRYAATRTKAEIDSLEEYRESSALALDTSQPYFFRGLVEYSPDGIVVVDEDGYIVFANKSCERLLGYAEEELVGYTVDVLVPSDKRPQHARHRKEAMIGMEPRSMGRLMFLEARTKSGTCIPVEIALTPLASDHGEFVVATVRDAKRQRTLINQLNDLASTDPLTGALNRRSFYKVAERELERKTRYSSSVSVMMIDIDHFKQINDVHGHEAGDKALKAMTRVCLEHLRKNDGFARLGGEEFAIIAPEISLDRAQLLAERLRQALSEIEVATDTDTFSFTVSMGLTEVADADDEIDTALKRADTALYNAKKSGRNRVIIAE